MTKAKLFRNGQSQAVRLPKPFRFRGGSVYIRRLGNAVVLLSEDDPWRPLLDGLAMLDGDFPARPRQPKPQRRRPLG